MEALTNLMRETALKKIAGLHPPTQPRKTVEQKIAERSFSPHQSVGMSSESLNATIAFQKYSISLLLEDGV